MYLPGSMNVEELMTDGTRDRSDLWPAAAHLLFASRKSFRELRGRFQAIFSTSSKGRVVNSLFDSGSIASIVVRLSYFASH